MMDDTSCRLVQQALALSVVIPVRDEAGNVERLSREIREALAARQFEIIFVDDGSRDATVESIRSVRDTAVPEIRF